ncbi:DUF192 domain-containing protein [Aestuariibius sp. HNIBRBA575]|uniref:DUF192 domain-containing protein n=1 Tax=Aestuariibius sp. HNIBRBA575 TaxID=3233343 RepID=UPI0034A34476
MRAVVLSVGLSVLAQFSTAQESPPNPAQALPVCDIEHVTVRGAFGRARFAIDLADDDQERSQGLMHVDHMPTMSGMLFVYDAPRHATFWMRNTLIPLDMIFADASGRVTHIHNNAIPLDDTVIDGGRDVQYVLEINGGMSSRLGISVGDRLHHPSVKTLDEDSCTEM